MKKHNAKGLSVVGLVLTLFFSTSAVAEEPDTNPVNVSPLVVTATLTDKSLKEVPGSVEIITRQDLEDNHAQTLSDAVEHAAGLVVTMVTGRNQRPSIRGTGTKHSLVLIDGRRMAAGFKSYTGMEQIPVDMIDRIEVLRGPASALYGSDAIGGVINVITRKTPDAFTLEATVEAGQTTYQEGEFDAGRALVGTRAGDVGFLLSGSFRESNRYDLDGVAPDDADDFQLTAVAGRVSYDFSEDHHLLTGFEYMAKNAKGLRDIERMDRERDADDDRLNLFLEYTGRPTAVSDLLVRVNHSTHAADIEINPETSLIPGAIGDESHSDRTLGQLEARFTTLLFEDHILTIGLEGREEEREDDSGLNHDVDTLSALVQDEYQATDRFYLLLGGRFDEHSDFGSNFAPRASVTVALMDNFRIKASAGQGFRAPDINELFIPVFMKRGKQIYQPNDDLDPETSTSYELSFEGEAGTFHGRVTGFQTDIDDLIEPVFDYAQGSGKKKKSYYTYQNIAEARMRGVELEAGVDLPLGFDLSGNLTFLDTENKDTGEELENRPDVNGSIKLGYTHTDLGLRAILRLNHTGERNYDGGDEEDVTWADAKVTQRILDHLDVFAGIDNITNAYTHRASADLAPSFYYAGLSVRF
ncbi:MAG: TonB-dependent receptor [Deltaproteobacteria bacterium]|nr:MAG: TonB-dependent receptor [Deltaproteobacteria bacterium]